MELIEWVRHFLSAYFSLQSHHLGSALPPFTDGALDIVD